jgi:hypothetical protein
VKLFRVIMSVHLKNAEWSYSNQVPSFYVHAVSPQDAESNAIRVCAASASAKDEFRTSGSVIQVDSDLEPMDNETYRSWSDL